MLCKHEANPQENNNAEAQPQQSHFATLLKLVSTIFNYVQKKNVFLRYFKQSTLKRN